MARRNRWLEAALVWCTLLVACAPIAPRDAREPFVAAPAPGDGEVTLYLYRPWQQGSELTKIEYYLDERLVVSLEAGQYTWLQVSKGRYQAAARVRNAVRDSAVPPREIEFGSKGPYFLAVAATFERASPAIVPLQLAPGVIAPLTVGRDVAESGRVWMFSDDGYVDRLRPYHFVSPVTTTVLPRAGAQ